MKSAEPPTSRGSRLADVFLAILFLTCVAAIYYVARYRARHDELTAERMAESYSPPASRSRSAGGSASQRPLPVFKNPTAAKDRQLPLSTEVAKNPARGDTSPPSVVDASGTPPVRPNETAAVLVSGALAEVTGRVKLDGVPPPETAIPLDPACGNLHQQPLKTRFYRVDAENHLADVFIYIRSGLEQTRFAMPEAPGLLDQIGCEYQPYVMGLRAGQELLVRNSDPLLHNVHPTPEAGPQSQNKEFNLAHMPNSADLKFVFPTPEVFLRFKCDIHPWMFAYVGIVDHPYFAVTAHDGTFRIPNVPTGKYTLEAFHRKAGRVTREVVIETGEPVTIDWTITVP